MFTASGSVKMNGNNKKHGRFPSREELLLWLSVTKDVEKTKEISIPKEPAAQTAKKEKHRKKEANVTRRHQASLPGKVQAGTDRRTAEKLRRGKIPIDRKLDLHGMTQSQALDELRSVICRAYESRDRLVLIVTGKGRNLIADNHWLSPEPGVLRRKLPEWLRTPPLDKIVLDVSPARQKHGGEGAFYVLLRRKRS